MDQDRDIAQAGSIECLFRKPRPVIKHAWSADHFKLFLQRPGTKSTCLWALVSVSSAENRMLLKHRRRQIAAASNADQDWTTRNTKLLHINNTKQAVRACSRSLLAHTHSWRQLKPPPTADVQPPTWRSGWDTSNE